MNVLPEGPGGSGGGGPCPLAHFPAASHCGPMGSP